MLGCSCLLWICMAVSCNSVEENRYQELVVGESTGTQLEAVGVELDPHFFSQNLTREDGSKTSDWQIVMDRVKKMEIQKFRVMVLPQWYEPVNDNEDPFATDPGRFTFDSPEMESLYKVLDLAQEQQMEVCIVVGLSHRGLSARSGICACENMLYGRSCQEWLDHRTDGL